MSTASPITGRWEFIGALLRRGRAVGPTHEFHSAEEFIALNDDDASAPLTWALPAVRTVAAPGASWLELRDDGQFLEHEQPGDGPRRWFNGGTAGEQDERGTWEPTSALAARLAPGFLGERMAPVYFDDVALEPSGELSRRIVSVVDGLYVDLVHAHYRRPGTSGSSSVELLVSARTEAIRAIANALSTPPEPKAKAAAGATLFAAGQLLSPVWELGISAGQHAAWACAPEMIASMKRIRTALPAISNRDAPYKRALEDAVDAYFDQLREVGIAVDPS